MRCVVVLVREYVVESSDQLFQRIVTCHRWLQPWDAARCPVGMRMRGRGCSATILGADGGGCVRLFGKFGGRKSKAPRSKPAPCRSSPLCACPQEKVLLEPALNTVCGGLHRTPRLLKLT